MAHRQDTRRMADGFKLIGGHHGFGLDRREYQKRKDHRASENLRRSIENQASMPSLDLEFTPMPSMRYLWYHAGMDEAGKLVGCGAIAPPHVPVMRETREVQTFVEELWVPDGVRVY